MRALNRKMFRELRAMWGQSLAIAFVIIAGVATFISMTSIYESLQHTLDAYYYDYQFAHGFISLRRAPRHLEERMRLIPGVTHVQTRIVATVNLEVLDFNEPIAGTIVSVPPGRQPDLNRISIRQGRLPEPGREGETVLNEVFAEAHHLQPGDQLTGIIGGRRRNLTVVGIGLSPEFLMQVQPGTLFPDPQRYGVLWMGQDALAAAYDMEGAFNEASFKVGPGATMEEVIQRMDDLLAPYGGRGAFAREDQPSHQMISEEFRQLRGLATVLPIIFLAVAAFLLNIVVTRLVNLQRQQIALLKAFGYHDRAVFNHYLSFVLVITVAGLAVGILTGVWLGRILGDFYLDFFRFPDLQYVLSPTVLLIGVILTLGAAFVGVFNSVSRAWELAPATAMQPEPPATYRPTLIERAGLQRAFDQPTRIVIRNLERQPVRSLLTVVGIAAAGALMIMGTFTQNSFDHLVDIQFGLAQREDMTVSFTEPRSSQALSEIRSLPGVLYAEPFRIVPVRLQREHRSYQTALEGIPQGAYLRQLLHTNLRPISIPREGVLLAAGLADTLQAIPGDMLTVHILEGRRLTREVPVVAIAEQFIGIGAYMDLEALHRLSGDGPVISGGYLTVDMGREAELLTALRNRPRVASIVSTERAIQSFYDEWAAVVLTFTFVMSIFAGIIAFGVIYNSARISLSERSRELASLRVLGFTRGEIAYIMLGEVAILLLVAIPLGMVLGSLGSYLTVAAIQTELLRLPIVLARDTFALAATVILISALASGLMIGRLVFKLDLIAVLKSRE